MLIRNHLRLLSLLVTAFTLSAQPPATPSDIDPAAMDALNRMGAWLNALKTFQVTSETTQEQVLDDGQKLLFASKADILAKLPNRLYAEVDGDLKHRLFLYNGSSFTMYLARAGVYASTTAPPTVRQLIDVAHDKYGIEITLTDLFTWGTPAALTNTITSALEIGSAQVGGVTCGHYAFRQPGVDWQIWIQRGDNPVPRKLVITDTTDEARPQHTAVLTWNLAPAFNEQAFEFDPPKGVYKVPFAEDHVRAGNE